MRPLLLALAVAGLALPAAAAMQAQPAKPLKPSESVWKPAPTPPGGIPWSLLESTKESTRLDENQLIRSKPVFPAQVKALNGKRIKVNGYMLPLGKGAKQTHFVLLAYPPDCPFHLNPSPMQFIEVKVKTPVEMNYNVRTIEGTLTLGGADEQGIFYRMSDAAEVS
jgi:hypothetical protein